MTISDRLSMMFRAKLQRFVSQWYTFPFIFCSRDLVKLLVQPRAVNFLPSGRVISFSMSLVYIRLVKGRKMIKLTCQVHFHFYAASIAWSHVIWYRIIDSTSGDGMVQIIKGAVVACQVCDDNYFFPPYFMTMNAHVLSTHFLIYPQPEHVRTLAWSP